MSLHLVLLINQLWNYTHFRHPTDEELRLLDISSNNNLASILFELLCELNISK